MLTAAFDIGGVLRRIRLPNTNVTNFAAMCALYRTLLDAEGWRVVIVTRKNAGIDKAMTVEELRQMGLPMPDELVVINGGTKLAAYRRIKPDIVFDDEDDCIADALSQGAAGAQIR